MLKTHLKSLQAYSLLIFHLKAFILTNGLPIIINQKTQYPCCIKAIHSHTYQRMPLEMSKTYLFVIYIAFQLNNLFKQFLKVTEGFLNVEVTYLTNQELL